MRSIHLAGRRVSPYIGFSIFLVIAAMIWRWTREYPLPLFDLYPLYYGGISWLETGSAYDLSTVVPASHHQFQVYRIGNGYPLPAVLLTLPLTLFSAHTAATIWIGLLVAGLLLTLWLLRSPLWLLLYVPLLEGLRIEQYTILIVILQLAALWALRTKRHGLLAVLCALMLTKPTHSVLFVILMLVLARNWKQQALAMTAVWGGSLALDPGWVREWLEATATYSSIVVAEPVTRLIGLLAIPALLARDMVSMVLIAQIALFPSPGVYAVSALPLGVLDDKRVKWISLASFLWPLVAVAVGSKAAATALTLALPVAVLAWLRGANEPSPSTNGADDTRRRE